ncbi:MAG: hypothetical protein JJ979_16250 [Roseibium sp.]|nr:hypothetical protein [Roseibium sp.]
MNGETETVQVENVSRTGMNVNGLGESEPGKTVSVNYQGEERLGRTVWTDGKSTGVQFIGGSS